MKAARIYLSHLNALDRDGFVAVCGPLFEHSPWIAERTWARRPFGTIDDLHRQLVSTVADSTEVEKVALISAHPDLVGKLAREGRLTHESTGEQKSAGLDQLSEDEVARFDCYNVAYRAKFGFPFVICARENRKETILAAFPDRLLHSRAREIETALAEIAKIARLRLLDRVRPD